MKSALALFSLASFAVATPAPVPGTGDQLLAGVEAIAENVLGDVFRGAEHLLDAVLHSSEEVVEKLKVQEWTVGNTEFVRQDDVVCE
ncbi:hypothetical protein FS749_013284 [Ceratobasidium sp. UAMH 11750]|nr:hypothetical protein FS749_013284 [Ceratobasidium sp. UAMH 11750]